MSANVAERVGFEPTVAINHTAFRERQSVMPRSDAHKLCLYRGSSRGSDLRRSRPPPPASPAIADAPCVGHLSGQARGYRTARAVASHASLASVGSPFVRSNRSGQRVGTLLPVGLCMAQPPVAAISPAPSSASYALSMLGLPDGVRACLFDLDGVLTQTAKVHATAWKEMFDGFLRERATKGGEPFLPFDPDRKSTRLNSSH